MSASAAEQCLRHGFPAGLAAAGYGRYGRRKRRGWAFVRFEESLGGSAMLPGRRGRSSRRRGNGTPATTVQGVSLAALDGAELVRWGTCFRVPTASLGRDMSCYPDSEVQVYDILTFTQTGCDSPVEVMREGVTKKEVEEVGRLACNIHWQRSACTVQMRPVHYRLRFSDPFNRPSPPACHPEGCGNWAWYSWQLAWLTPRHVEIDRCCPQWQTQFKHHQVLRPESHAASGMVFGPDLICQPGPSFFHSSPSNPQQETFPYHQLVSKTSLIIAAMASKFMVNVAFETRLLLQPSRQRTILFWDRQQA